MKLIQQTRLVLGILFALLGLSACTTIEHRSETIPLAPLPAIAKNSTDILSPLWKTQMGSRYGCEQQQGAALTLALRDNALFVAGCDGRVWSLNVENGKKKWVRDLKSPITAGPSLADNLIVLATKQPAVVGLNRNTGDIVWEQTEQSEIFSPLSFANGKVFIHALNDSVRARRAADGEMLWEVQNPPLNLVLRKSGRPVPFGRELLVGFADGKLIAFKQATGAITWIQELSTPIGHDEFQRMVDVSADPVVSGDRVLAVNFQGKLNALQAASGERVWSIPISSFSGLALQNNIIVVSDSQGVLVALNKKSGKTIWTQAGLKGRRLSTPRIAGDTIFVGDEQGQLHVLRLATGEYLTRTKIGSGAIEAAPVVLGKRLFVLGQGAVVSAYYLGDFNNDNAV